MAFDEALALEGLRILARDDSEAAFRILCSPTRKDKLTARRNTVIDIELVRDAPPVEAVATQNIGGVGRMSRAYLEPDEVKRLEKATTNLRDRLLIRLLSHLGCRITEALNVGVEDIDFSNSTVTILHLKTRMRLICPHCNARVSRSHSFCPKCGQRVLEAVTKELEHRRQRVLPMDIGTLAML